MYMYNVQLKGLHVKHVRNYKFTVRKSTAKNTTNASAARAIVIIGAARKRAPRLSMTAATKTNRTRMLRPLILSSCRSMAARPTTRRTTNPTKAAPARIAINLAASNSGEIKRLGPTKTSVNRGAVKDYLLFNREPGEPVGKPPAFRDEAFSPVDRKRAAGLRMQPLLATLFQGIASALPGPVRAACAFLSCPPCWSWSSSWSRKMC